MVLSFFVQAEYGIRDAQYGLEFRRVLYRYNAGMGHIVVTARRREETLQSVPVSITAISSDMLEKKSVQDLSDVATLTPGFRFSQEGGKNQPSLSLRGLGQLPIGEGVPAIVAYFNDVPLSKEIGRAHV